MFEWCKGMFGGRDTPELPLAIEFEWCQIPQDCFHLEAFLGKVQIGAANGKLGGAQEFHLDSIDVFSEHRSKGHGSKIIKYLIKMALKKNCKNFVFVGVSVKNTNAAKLYQKFKAAPRPINGTKEIQDFVLSL
jgi:ribosomal protein S18 acetylase RimI-like enzyme